MYLLARLSDHGVFLSKQKEVMVCLFNMDIFFLQIDSVDRPSWQAQLSGQKMWTLIPPPECEHACQSMTTVINKGEVCKSTLAAAKLNT